MSTYEDIWAHEMWQPEVDIAAAALDRVTPGWFHRVNINTLNMGSLSRCILGQVYHGEAVEESECFNGYMVGLKKLLATHEQFHSVVFAAHEVKDCWIEAIVTRLAGVPPTKEYYEKIFYDDWTEAWRENETHHSSRKNHLHSNTGPLTLEYT